MKPGNLKLKAFVHLDIPALCVATAVARTWGGAALPEASVLLG